MEGGEYRGSHAYTRANQRRLFSGRQNCGIEGCSNKLDRQRGAGSKKTTNGQIAKQKEADRTVER